MNVISAEEIQQKFSMKETMEAIEHFYKEKEEDYIAPDRMHIEDGDNTALLMPAFYGKYFATKLVGVAPNNTNLNKETIHGLMILYNRETMEPLFICDGIAITSLRTGALGGLGMKYLAKREAKTLGIIGTGTQGWSHLQSALVARGIQEVHIFNRTEEKAHAFKERAEKEFPHLTFHVSSVEELVKKADIIVTTTTSKKPVLPDLDPSEWKGKQIVGVGSFRPAMQEISDQVLQVADEVYVDASSAFRESGDMIRAKELRTDLEGVWDLEKIIMENHHPSQADEKTIIYKSVGASIFDLVTAQAVYEKYYK